ncbi:MAG TPA: PRC-barrel domain-containing protein [Longimicrobiales bacterium]|nr:PRC-barrel domain-containing protein [Longimicrobiales bacterium]
MLRVMSELQGFTITATDGDIGSVEAFYFDDETFTVRHLVVDTGGWLTGRKVLISPRAVGGIDWDARRITVALTKAQVEQSPEIDTALPVGRQQEIAQDAHYGYPHYWAGPYLWGVGPYPVMTPTSADALDQQRRWDWQSRDKGDPHLRSSTTVIGYYIEAEDGDIGHVEDFLVDDGSWAIRYVIVDTRNWWPGKKVLISPEWVDRVDWHESKVYVSVTRAEIEKSPEYDPSGPILREYEGRLHAHYGRPTYWRQ